MIGGTIIIVEKEAGVGQMIENITVRKEEMKTSGTDQEKTIPEKKETIPIGNTEEEMFHVTEDESL